MTAGETARRRILGKKKKVMTLDDLREAPPRKEPVARCIYRYTLTGSYRRDEAYVKGVEKLVEKFDGEFYFGYAYKDLYRFEIGGEFQTQADADKFEAAKDQFNAAFGDDIPITSKEQARDMWCEVIGQIAFVGYFGKKHLTEKERQDIRAVICREVDKALLA